MRLSKHVRIVPESDRSGRPAPGTAAPTVRAGRRSPYVVAESGLVPSASGVSPISRSQGDKSGPVILKLIEISGYHGLSAAVLLFYSAEIPIDGGTPEGGISIWCTLGPTAERWPGAGSIVLRYLNGRWPIVAGSRRINVYYNRDVQDVRVQ